MAIDLRQVMAAFLTASMFLMLANMIKRDNIDPLLENIGKSSPNVQYDVMRVTKQSLVEIPGAAKGLWTQQNIAIKPCWTNPSSKGRMQSKGYIFFSLTKGPEHHALQVANAVVVARHLGATLVLPDITGSKVKEKRHFGEIYDINRFITSLNGVVQVVKDQTTQVQMRNTITIKVPNMVSENYIASRIKPLFKKGRNLRLVINFSSITMAKAKKPKTPHECLAMFEALDLQQELKQLVNSMIGTLRSLGKKSYGHFVAVDLRIEMLGKDSCKENGNNGRKKCQNAEEIGELLKKIGFERDTSIYLTQSGWDTSLNALRDVFPNTFTKDAIMPMDGLARFLDWEESPYVQKIIDLHICSESDVFIPSYFSLFYAIVSGKRITSGKANIMLPWQTNSTSPIDYNTSPFLFPKSHFAYSCFC